MRGGLPWSRVCPLDLKGLGNFMHGGFFFLY